MTMFQPSRDQARRFFIASWRKYRERHPLEPIEALAVEHILRHPEYHGLLEDEEGSLSRDWSPEMGETNPFLHLGLHLSISEQLSIDQPHGIVARYQTLLHRLGDEHAAQHAMMDCLVEMIWQAQRYDRPPDGAAYLACLKDKCGR
jgi:hypothetical protein